MSTCQWLETFDWKDMQIDGNQQDTSQWTSSTSHTVPDPQINASAASVDIIPNFIGWPPTGKSSDGDGSARGGPSPSIQLHKSGHGLRSGSFESSSKSSNSNSNNTRTDKTGPDVAIARLSQLSTRLYPLHRSSCTLAENAGSSLLSGDRNQSRQTQLIDETAFILVAAWLVHVSSNVSLVFRTDSHNPKLEAVTTGDTLQDAFSASHHLLETLRCLKVDVDTANPASTPATTVSTSQSNSCEGAAQVDFWSSITPKPFRSTSASDESVTELEQCKGSLSYATRTSNQYSNTVVCHLVIACHTLLLNIYIKVLIALQHDADRWMTGHPTGKVDAADVDAHVDAAALADIRLVMAVQLCSYLIERQHQAVDLYLFPPPLPPSSIFLPCPSAAATANREVMSDLKMEVQQRLIRLRQTLRI
ncbi:MAG: hypothetical protein Q9179_006631 [Wetmoreana sp. 5 TL-2023]